MDKEYFATTCLCFRKGVFWMIWLMIFVLAAGWILILFPVLLALCRMSQEEKEQEDREQEAFLEQYRRQCRK